MQFDLFSGYFITMSFAQLKSIKDLTDGEKKTLKERCYDSFEEVEGGHFFYKGRDRNSYAQVTVKVRGKSYGVGRHLLALFLQLMEDGVDIDSNWEGKQASHLCHRKSCFNPRHVVLEDPSVNMQRVHCVAEGKCRAHDGAPPCMI